MNALTRGYTVVIPLYNKARHILDTLADVIKQSYLPDEVIIINDGSTDGGPDLIRSAMNNRPELSCVRLINQENAGVSRARNRGIEEARYSHIIFLDGDDNWDTGFIEEIHSLVETFDSARAFATRYYKVVENGKRISAKIRLPRTQKGPDILKSYFSVASRGDLPFTSSSICVEKKLFEEIGGFPEGEPMGEDQDMWSKIALASNIAYSPKELSCYRTDASNRVYNRMCPKEECPFSRRLHKKVLAGTVAKSEQRSVLAYTAAHLLDLARQNIRAGNFNEANSFLADERCNLLLAKRLKWMAISRFKQAYRAW